jgi:hypothetical protein
MAITPSAPVPSCFLLELLASRSLLLTCSYLRLPLRQAHV